VLLDRLPAALRSKAQLFGQLEKHFSTHVTESIVDIGFFQRETTCFASVKFASGRKCYQIFLDHRAQFAMIGWEVYLDVGQRAYTRKIALIEQLALRQATIAPLNVDNPRRQLRELHDRADDKMQTNRSHHQRPVYTCDRRVTCLLVDYEFLSDRESSQELMQIFRDFRPRNAERHNTCWHVHLDDEETVEAATPASCR